jgi:asparagine synthase (glutamine-hydrolysing)
MCGIFCCYNRSGDLAAFRPRAIALSKKQRHRGPDWSGCYMGKDTVMVHERLAIVGVGESLIPHMSSLEDLEDMEGVTHNRRRVVIMPSSRASPCQAFC